MREIYKIYISKVKQLQWSYGDWCFRIHVCFQHHYKLCSLIFDPSNPWLFLELTGACYVAAGLYFRLISKLPTAQFLTPAAPNRVRRLYYQKSQEKNEKLDENMHISSFYMFCSARWCYRFRLFFTPVEAKPLQFAVAWSPHSYTPEFQPPGRFCSVLIRLDSSHRQLLAWWAVQLYFYKNNLAVHKYISHL